MAEPLEIVAAVEALLAADGAARSPAGTCSSPPARRTSRSTRSAISPIARPASRATPSPLPLPRRAPGDARERAGRHCRPARRHDHPCRDRPRDAGSGRGGSPRRRRDHGGGGRRLAAAKEARGKIKKDGSGTVRAAAAGREPGHPRHARPSPYAPPGARHRLRRRDRRSRQQRAGEAQGEGRRLDPRQRRLARHRRHGRRRQHDPPHRAGRRRGVADAAQDARWRRGWSRGSPISSMPATGRPGDACLGPGDGGFPTASGCRYRRRARQRRRGSISSPRCDDRHRPWARRRGAGADRRRDRLAARL